MAKGKHAIASPLPHRWYHKARAILNPRWPARGDGFGFGVKAKRIWPMLVEIAKARALPAAKSVIRQRHRNWHVNPHHADIDAARKIARGIAIAGENGNAIAILMLAG